MCGKIDRGAKLMALRLNGSEVTIKTKNQVEDEIARCVISAAIDSNIDRSGLFYMGVSDFLKITDKWSELNLNQREDKILQIIVRAWEEKLKVEHLFAMITYIEIDRFEDQILIEFHPQFIPFVIAFKEASKKLKESALNV